MMSTPTFQTTKPFTRLLNLTKFKLLAVFLTLLTTILFASYGWKKSLNHNLPALAAEKKDPEPDFWNWQTITHFQKYQSQGPFTTEDICADFPSNILERVQVVLKTGATESADRINASMNSVTRCISNLLVVSDRATELHGHRVHDVLADLAPLAERLNVTDFKKYEALRNGDKNVGAEEGWRLDRFKFLPMIERAKEANPTAEWFVFLETDTYLFWDNLFRLLGQFDPGVPLYFGSPSPGFWLENEQRVWFAYGGSGFVLSRAAVEILTEREIGEYGEYLEPSVSERYMEVVDRDCCGDSVLGFALYQKGINISGLWPMFNAHSLHGIPFDAKHWCQPVISLHKSLFSDMTGLAKWESKRDRTNPVLYSDLADYLQLGTLPDQEDWDNGDFGGHIEPPESAANGSLDACRQACQDSDSCLSFTWDSSGQCVFVRTIRLGAGKTIPPNKLTAGWDNSGIQRWRESNTCEAPMWVKPSIKRIF
ncbi:hypothetical protein N7486_006196 [Penicillium sp. IBT 16267x]|nr:hypothetical protein N7486_006196 [Penicillium sp. IBT 16267x]